MPIYLSLEEIKKQLNIDPEYTGDDEFLELIGESAEDLVSQLVNCPLQEIVAQYGGMPASIRHALRMLCDWMYSQQRGSSSEAIDIPNAIFHILKLFRDYK